MDPILALAFYVILWWLSFFLMLPIGVRSLGEAGVHAPGHDQGAPAAHNLRKKALWAAGLAAVLWMALMIVLYVFWYGR